MPKAAVPYKEGKTWSFRRRVLGQDFYVSGHTTKTEASDAKVSAEYVERHIQIGIEALRLIRRHGKSVKHLRFDE